MDGRKFIEENKKTLLNSGWTPRELEGLPALFRPGWDHELLPDGTLQFTRRYPDGRESVQRARPAPVLKEMWALK